MRAKTALDDERGPRVGAMNRVSTRKLLIATTGALLSLGALTGCSGSDGGTDDTDEPAPVGGINGPARVDPDSGVADNGEQGD